MKKIFFLIMAFVFVLSAVGYSVNAAEMINSRSVVYMDAEITKAGTIELKPNADRSFANTLTVTLDVPQYTGMQKKEILSVDGPGEYTETSDEWGNDMIELKWKDPPVGKELPYAVTYHVVVKEGKIEGRRKDIKYTDYTRPDPEIMRTAKALQKGSGLESVFAVSKWVYEHVVYDSSLTQTSKTASWIWENKAGTCDEFANLAISMLKYMGYNAWYAAGWAYSGESWQPHAWVKVYLDDRVVSFDPTWLEYPVDATHIEFTTLPDSNNTEYVRSEGAGYRIVWTKKDIVIKTNELRHDNKTLVEAAFLEDRMKGNRYGMATMNLESVKDCFQGTVSATSCLNGRGEALLDFVEKEKTVSFCGKKSVRFYFRVPMLQPYMKYTCPVVFSTGAGDRQTKTISIEGNAKHIDMRVNAPGSVVKGGEAAIEAVLDDSFSGYVYADFAGKSKSAPAKNGEAFFSFSAPAIPGDYDAYVYADNGAFSKKTIKVIDKRSIYLEKVEVPREVFVGDEIIINATVRADENTDATISLDAGSENNETAISILGGTRRDISFMSIAEEAGRVDVVLSVNTDTYQDGWSGYINVKKHESTIKEGASEIIGQITSFFDWLIELITEMIGG